MANPSGWRLSISGHAWTHESGWRVAQMISGKWRVYEATGARTEMYFTNQHDALQHVNRVLGVMQLLEQLRSNAVRRKNG